MTTLYTELSRKEVIRVSEAVYSWVYYICQDLTSPGAFCLRMSRLVSSYTPVAVAVAPRAKTTRTKLPFVVHVWLVGQNTLSSIPDNDYFSFLDLLLWLLLCLSIFLRIRVFVRKKRTNVSWDTLLCYYTARFVTSWTSLQDRITSSIVYGCINQYQLPTIFSTIICGKAHGMFNAPQTTNDNKRSIVP